MQLDEHITHDFAAVEKHLELMQGPHRLRLMIGHGIKAAAIILALGLAIPISAIGIGYAIHLGQEPKVGPEGPQGPKGERGPIGPRGPSGKDASAVETPDFPVVPPKSGQVVRNYVIFNEQAARLRGKDFSVNAGHNYASSAQDTYDSAYCYAMTDVDGIHARLELSYKLGPDAPIEPQRDPSAITIGLTNADLAVLRRKCSYL